MKRNRLFLMLVALGGMMSERSGVINLGLEGIMVMGALGGALTMSYMPASVTGFSVFLLHNSYKILHLQVYRYDKTDI